MRLEATERERQTLQLALMYALVLWHASSFRRQELKTYGDEARRLQHAFREEIDAGGAPPEFSQRSLECLTAVARECATSSMTDVPVLAKQMQPILARLAQALSQEAR